MKKITVFLICCTLVQNLFATVENLDESGSPLKKADAAATLRIAPGGVLKSFYGKRIILLSEEEKKLTRPVFSEDGKKTSRVPWGRLDVAAGELGKCLQQMTGETFITVREDAPEGIVLARADAPGLTVSGLKALNGKGPEAFLIQSDGIKKLYLVGNSDLGIQHAVYAYLDMLGCRWFFAGDNWTIIPSLAGVGVKINALSYPAFDSREFFGSGGLESLRHPYDPEGKATGRWTVWKDRNRFGGTYTIKGHYYQDFINKNKALFEAHPEYRPEVKGKRVPVSGSMKLCYSNPDVIDLFVKDRVAACKEIIAKEVPKSIFAISVEPSDGYDHCECAECVKLGSVTDRVFSLANHVAHAIRPLSPYAHVSLYAYNMHSPPPSITIEPNTIVQVGAYGFNKSNLPAEKLIEAWGRKCSALGVYDYWCIPQWGKDEPYINFNDGYPKRVKFWHDNNVKCFNLETTYSGGAVGPALYMVSRLAWEPDQDPKPLFDDFYDKAFGSARPPMQRMLERWSSGFKLVESEIADSFKDIDEALHLTSDPAVKKRINDYLGYIEYLRLRYEFVNTDNVKDRTAWIERCRLLCHHLYRIHHSCMNHTTFTSGVLFWGTKGVNRPTTEEELDVPAKRSSTPLSDEELSRILQEGVKKYIPAKYDRIAYPADDYAPMRPVTSLSSNTRETPVLTGDDSHKLGLFFWVPENVNEIILSVRFHNPPPTWDNFTVKSLKNMALKEELFAATVPFDKDDARKWNEYKIPVNGSGMYGIRILNVLQGVELRFPENLPLGIEAKYLRVKGMDPARPQQNHAFFLVPANLKLAAFSSREPELLEVRDLDGNPKPREISGTTVLFQLNNGDKPIVQELFFPSKKYSGKLPLPLNISPMMSFSSDNILVPVKSQASTLK